MYRRSFLFWSAKVAVATTGAAAIANNPFSQIRIAPRRISVKILFFLEGAQELFSLNVARGSTVFNAAVESGLQPIEVRESPGEVLLPVVYGFQNLFYRVNGERIEEPWHTEYPLSDGDVVIWSTT